MSSSNETSFFDLHTSGVGYLNRIREVTPAKGKKGKAFWACDINALVGASDNVSYVHFDANVVRGDVEHLVRRCKDAVDAKKKVLISFRLGDLAPDTFVYSRGDRAGETGITLKTRLIYIGWIKVDGKLVYKAEPKPTENDQRELEVPATGTPVEQQATASEPSEPAIEAVDETAADASALAVAESF
jgi:hypothetical protein